MSTIKKLDPNFMVIKVNLGYAENIILPYKEGIQLLAALENMRVYTKSYGEESRIRDVKSEDISSSTIGVQEYGEAILRTTLLAKDDSN